MWNDRIGSGLRPLMAWDGAACLIQGKSGWQITALASSEAACLSRDRSRVLDGGWAMSERMRARATAVGRGIDLFRAGARAGSTLLWALAVTTSLVVAP